MFKSSCIGHFSPQESSANSDSSVATAGLVEIAPAYRPSLYTYLTAEKHRSGFSSATTAASVTEVYGISRKVVLVTGAQSEVGSALCSALCAGGATVLLGYHSSEAAAHEAADQLTCKHSDGGGRAVAVLCDFSSMKTAQESAAAVQALRLQLDVIVHCSSFTSSECQTTEDGLEKHFAVNYLNPLLFTLLLLPNMSKAACSTGRRRRRSVMGPSHVATQHDHPNRQQQQQQHVPRVIWSTCSAHYITYMPAQSSTGCRLAWKIQGSDVKSAFMPAQAFGQSKLAAIMACRQLALKAAAAGIRLGTYAVHPGITEKGLVKYGGYAPGTLFHGLKSALAAGLSGAGLLKTSHQAAASLAYAALAPELTHDDEVFQGSPCWAGKVTSRRSSQQGQSTPHQQVHHHSGAHAAVSAATAGGGTSPSTSSPRHSRPQHIPRPVSITFCPDTPRAADAGNEHADYFQQHLDAKLCELTSYRSEDSAASASTVATNSCSQLQQHINTHAGLSSAEHDSCSVCSDKLESVTDCWWGYIEDCSLSMPSVAARSAEDGEALWSMSERIIAKFLGPYQVCPLIRNRPSGYDSPFRNQQHMID